MNLDEMKKQLDSDFKDASEKIGELIRAIDKMRSQEVDLSELDTEQRNAALALGRDIDARTSYLLRSLLVRYGNVLFL